MAKATRKEWTKTMAVLRLKDIEKALADVEELAQRGGKMPCALRTKLKNRLKGISDLIKDFQEWQPCLSAETVRSLKSPRQAHVGVAIQKTITKRKRPARRSR